MFPAQTSLIPAVVALTRFLEEQGLSAAFANYPYWYLRSTPFRYLTGPIIPSVLVFLHRLLPNFSLFEIMFGLLGVVWVIGGVGVYFLVRSLANSSRGIPWPAALFYLLGPIVPFLFRFSDGLYLLAFSFLPFILLLQHKVHRVEKGEHGIRKIDIALGALITIVILLDSLIIPTLVLGMLALLLATSGWQRIEERLKRIFLIFTFSFLISTLWYAPGYWLTLLGSPSFGGKGLAQVLVWLGKLLPAALALGLALVSVRFFKKRHPLRDFTFFWLFIFGFLTILRFLSDPDFWLDWTAYGMELQLGIALGLGLWLGQRSPFQNAVTSDGTPKPNGFLNLNRLTISALFAFYILIFAFLFNKYVLGTLQRDITQTVEYRVGEWLAKNTKPGEKVFLSGTTAFWLNSLSASWRIPQVRGGRDQASVNSTWREAVWEIRQGEDPEKSLKWLKDLGVGYLVVHSSTSSEYYHDFKNPQKFEGLQGLKKVFSDQDSTIYMVEETSLAR